MIRLLSATLLLALFACSVVAAEVPGSTVAEKDPIRISADRLETGEDLRLVTFFGSVVARQGEMVLYADQVAIRYGDGRDIREAVATGSVRIILGERTATGEQGIYLPAQGRIVLTGSPRVRQGDDFVEGETITVFLDGNRSIVEGGEGRVKALIHPPGEKE